MWQETIAASLSLSLPKLLVANTTHHPGLSAKSKLKPGTKLVLPGSGFLLTAAAAVRKTKKKVQRPAASPVSPPATKKIKTEKQIKTEKPQPTPRKPPASHAAAPPTSAKRKSPTVSTPNAAAAKKKKGGGIASMNMDVLNAFWYYVRAQAIHCPWQALLQPVRADDLDMRS